MIISRCLKLRAARIAVTAITVIAGIDIARARDVLIRNAQVHTMTSAGTLAKTDVLVRAGKITAVGTALAGGDATVIEANGRPLTPGLFAGLTDIGLEEVQAEESTVDQTLQLKAPLWDMHWRPEFDVTLAYNPRSTLQPIAQIEGLTWTVLTPGSGAGGSIIRGQGAAVSFNGSYDAVLPGSRTLFVSLGSDALPLAGGSRAAQYMLLDQAVREARAQEPLSANSLLLSTGREVLARYLRGGRVAFDVQRAADIRQVIALAHRYKIKPVIVGGSEAWLVAKELADADVPVMLDALQNLPTTFDRLASRLDNAALLAAAGVRISFVLQISDASSNARKIRQYAGNAVANGLPPDTGLAALTSTPAEIFGIANTRGHIAVGQVADLVLWSGDPLEVTTVADQVWIDGNAISMRSRQTELRDRYLEKLRQGQAR
jgi:hypothetical protein